MIIDKVLPYWTEEDRFRLLAVQKELDLTVHRLMKERDDGSPNATKTLREVQKLDDQATEISGEVEARYIKATSKKGILDDVREIVNAVVKQDFLARLDRRINEIATLKAEGATEESLDILRKYTTEDFQNCFSFILQHLRVQLNAIADDVDGREKVYSIVAERAGLWYEAGDKLDTATIQPYTTAPELAFRFPDKHLQSLTKASTKIFDRHIQLADLRQFELDVSPNSKKASKSFSVYVDMSAPELKGTENITEFDESIFNAVISVANANPHGFFTPKQLATHLLYGDNPSDSNPSPQRVGAVTKSIEKQRHIDITIDWTDHARLNGKIPDGATFKVRGYMLPVKEWIATLNGQELHGYKLLDIPPLYQYAQQVGQIGTHPAKMLNVPVNLDETKIVIRDFLLKEIAHMKNTTHWNKTISINRILEVAGENPETVTRDKKRKLLTAVRAMLDYWKTELIDGKPYIKGYRENVKGKAVQSITIETL